MKSIKYYVCSCQECRSPVLVKIDFMEFNSDCCLEFKNLKVIKEFNDEAEAKTYLDRYMKNEE
ncbi:hypothetical protein JXC34_02335 [Candidatus Woesearchaeota archaeon]|nr:hypothetical protein [Candidatus Woesearchaeota archaeon]